MLYFETYGTFTDNLYGSHCLIRTAHTYSAFPNCSKIMAGAVQLIFHIVATSNFAFGIYYDCWVLEMPEHYVKSTNPFAGRWKYLTFWNMVLQLVYFSHCLLNDFYGTSSLVKRERAYLQKLRDYLFGALAFPLALFVSITFWGLWAVDREIIFPSALDAFFPSWLNHILHSSIAVFATLEMFLVPKMYPSRGSGLAGLATLMLGYLIWVFFIAFHTNFWVYPVLAVLGWSHRLMFIASLMVFSSILYFSGEKLHFMIWDKKTKQDKKSTQHIKATDLPIKSAQEGKSKRKKN